MNYKVGLKLRSLYAEKILDLTNIGTGVLLFSQFISDKGFSWLTTILGLVLATLGYIFVYFLYQKEEK